MNIDLVTTGHLLKTTATIFSGVFVGGALYVTLVEQPARMTHDPTTAIIQWKPSFVRAASLQSKLSLLSSASAFGAYFCLRNTSADALNWLGCGCMMLSMLPFTLIFIRPLNNQLIETEKCISVKGEGWITENLKHWGKLHSVRAIVSLGAFSFMIYTLNKR